MHALGRRDQQCREFQEPVRGLAVHIAASIDRHAARVKPDLRLMAFVVGRLAILIPRFLARDDRPAVFSELRLRDIDRVVAWPVEFDNRESVIRLENLSRRL